MARAAHEHAAPQNVALKAGSDLFDDTAPKVEWLDMPPLPEPGKYGAFPYDHSPVWLTADGEQGVVAQWRTTREFDRKTLRWAHVGFWTERNTGGRRFAIEPLGYRRIVE